MPKKASEEKDKKTKKSTSKSKISSTKKTTSKKKSEVKKEKKKGKGLKVFGIILLILLIIAAGVYVGGYSFIKDKLRRLIRVDINIEELEANENMTGYRNIALFAVDTRPGEDQSRSDGIIIVSINNETKDVRLISVYRDTYLQVEYIDDNGKERSFLDKVTHAYFYGGAPAAVRTLNKNLDLNITEYVTVNFEVVAKIIDEIGGIDIDIDSSEIRYMNQYIAGTIGDIGDKSLSSPRITETGLQTLDGIQAVAYARIRYTDGGDYKRTERMRDVIEAAFAKVKKMNIVKINKLVDSILDAKDSKGNPLLHTNLKDKAITDLLTDLMKYNITESIGWPYDTKGITLGGVWYGPPVTLKSNVEQLHEEMFPDDEDYEVSDYVRDISYKIINRTGYSSM